MAIRKSTGKPSRSTSVRSAASARADAGHPTRPAPPDADHPRPQSENEAYPIAAIGVSAGSLEALTKLMRALPADTQLSFILLQRLSPNHESMLQALIAKVTSLPVVEARDAEELRHGTVYVMPPNVLMTLDRNRLRLQPRPEPGPDMPGDVFFRSLAESQPHRAIAIILSGAGTDGTLGIQKVKAAGGITFAQDARSAKFDSRPLSAQASGWVDFVLPPEDIAAELERICHDYRREFGAKGGAAVFEVGQLVRKSEEREARRLNAELEDHIRQVTSANRSLEREVFDRQRAEEGLREIVKDLEAFSFSVSHDLRAHLRSIQDVAEALREDYADRLAETGRDYARRIVEAAQRLDSLLKDLLTYSRLGREETEVRLCSLDAAARIALDQSAPTVRAREAMVEMEANLGGGGRSWIELPGGTA